MDTEKEITELKRLVAENNKILHGLRRKSRIGTLFTLVKWVIIALVIFGAYTFVQPVISAIMSSYDAVMEGVGQIQEVKDKVPDFDFKSLLNRN